MGQRINGGKKLLDDMQENYAQWYVGRSSLTKKVNVMDQEKNDELRSKIDELIGMIRGKDDASINVVAEIVASDVNFVVRGNFNSGWIKQNSYGNNYQKPYTNHAGAPNSYGNNVNTSNGNGNHQNLDETLKQFISAQTNQNNYFNELIKPHDTCLGQMAGKHEVSHLICKVCMNGPVISTSELVKLLRVKLSF